MVTLIAPCLRRRWYPLPIIDLQRSLASLQPSPHDVGNSPVKSPNYWSLLLSTTSYWSAAANNNIAWLFHIWICVEFLNTICWTYPPCSWFLHSIAWLEAGFSPLCTCCPVGSKNFDILVVAELSASVFLCSYFKSLSFCFCLIPPIRWWWCQTVSS